MKKYRVWVTPDLSQLEAGFETYIEAHNFDDARDILQIAIEYFSNTSLEFQLFDSPEHDGEMLFFRPFLNVNFSHD